MESSGSDNKAPQSQEQTTRRVPTEAEIARAEAAAARAIASGRPPQTQPGGGFTVFEPKTIEQLKTYCAERGMLLDYMRFFIDEDYKGAMAFGICRDGDSFVVYKNKADGSRAERYRGPDEAYAVKEIFTKLVQECHNRGIYPDRPLSGGETSAAPSRLGYSTAYSGRSSRASYSGASGNYSARKQERQSRRIIYLLIGVAVFFIILLLSANHGGGRNGYYRANNGQLYYRYNSSWYVENAIDQWVYTSAFPDSDYSEHYVGSSYDSDWGGSDFTRTQIWQDLQRTHSSSGNGSSRYSSWSSSDSDWDSDWSSSSGWSSSSDYSSWDFGDTDWDSDW